MKDLIASCEEEKKKLEQDMASARAMYS